MTTVFATLSTEQRAGLEGHLSHIADSLLALEDTKRDGLAEALGRLALSAPLGSTLDSEALAMETRIPAKAARAAFHLADAITELGGATEVSQVFAAIADRQGIPWTAEQVNHLRLFCDRLGPIAAALKAADQQLRQLAGAMPTLDEFSIQCDLRYLPGSNDDEFVTAPVAIIRIGTDEDEKDFVLQCTEAGLHRIVDAAKEASVRLARLSSLVKSKTSAAKE